MANRSNYNEKDAQWWKKVATRLAIALAAWILASGLVFGWMSTEKKALDSFKKANEHLRTVSSNIRKKFTTANNQLKECKAKNEEFKTKNEELKEAIFKLKVENADLKAMVDE